MTNPPPCHVHGKKLNPCATALAAWQISGNGPLGGDHWRGWRIAGRDLVSPDGQRINARRLIGILWREASERRVSAARARSRKAGLPGGDGRVQRIDAERSAPMLGGRPSQHSTAERPSGP